MPELIDRKFRFEAISIKSGKKYTQQNAIVFLVKDALLPNLLDKYIELCSQAQVDERQLKGVILLKDRVMNYQRKYPNKVASPDVAEGREEERICRPNK